MITEELSDFEFGDLNVKLEFASGSSVSYLLTDPESRTEAINEVDGGLVQEDGSYIIVTSFITETALGKVVIHHPCLDWVRARIFISIPQKWHTQNFMMTLRSKMFEILEIPIGDTWELIAIDGEAVLILNDETQKQ